MESDTPKDRRGSKGEEVEAVVSSTADLAAFREASLVLLAVALATAPITETMMGFYMR